MNRNQARRSKLEDRGWRKTRVVAFFAILYHLSSILSADSARAQVTSIANSPHNLSASGPGTIRATAEQEICIFCHTPHNAAPIQPLWNRNVPVSAYTVYTSNSLVAKPGQPTGSSKLCLSCHDGSIAVGSVLSRSQPIAMAGGMTTLPPGHTNLGTDLSDDHPVSFRYDDTLATRNSKLKSPSQLPQAVKLDGQQEMQCTSCHDAHDNEFGRFLVMRNESSQLCNSCHVQGVTTVTNHAQCASCHQPHTAPSGPYLLKGRTVTDTCISCHGGGVGPDQGSNISADLNKVVRHDTHPAVNLKDHIPADVDCKDCHEPHTMDTAAAPGAPIISPRLGRIDGVNIAGAAVPRAQYEYEVCFKCHDNAQAVQPLISRVIVQQNTRLKFEASAVSSHPVTTSGKDSDVPSLRPGLTTASVIYCTDCHSSDTAVGATGPKGPHGSNVRGLLTAGYETADNTPESANAYALCYRCHDRSVMLNSPTFPQHNSHVVNDQTPCSVCHDPHGISSAQGNMTNASHLINFDTTVVTRDPVTQRLEYQRTGTRSGQCFLSCHGVAHSPKAYPSAVTTPQLRVPQPLRRGRR
jgi:predicted CXXCH cytochrome family protein